MTNEKEIWKAVENYEDLYEVSNLGRVKSLARRLWVTKGLGYYSKLNCKVLKAVDVKAHKNYPSRSLTVLLHDETGRQRLFRVKRLVAQAFVPNSNPETNKYVKQIDGDYRNCKASNLEWVSYKKVWDDSILETVRKAIKCIELNKVFRSIQEAAKYFNVSHTTISKQLRGKSKAVFTKYHFEYIKEEFKDD